MRNLSILLTGLFVGLLGSVSSALADGPATRPTLYLVGDSTVHVGTPNQLGWGEPIQAMFDSTKIDVKNKAMGGRSSRSFIQEGRWDKVLETLTKGDYVIIQLGHNDGGPLAGDNRERGSIKGIGEETEDVTLTLDPNKGKQVTIHTYGWYLRKYVNDTKEKGATPIICSPIPRCPRPGEAVAVPTEPKSYNLWAQQVAEAEHVAFIDLNRLIWKKWVDEKLTPEQLKDKYFTPADFTHTGEAGAALNATAVTDGIKQLDLPLKETLKP
jgi:rhamnogalacturonan acetylesterase